MPAKQRAAKPAVCIMQTPARFDAHAKETNQRVVADSSFRIYASLKRDSTLQHTPARHCTNMRLAKLPEGTAYPLESGQPEPETGRYYTRIGSWELGYELFCKSSCRRLTILRFAGYAISQDSIRTGWHHGGYFDERIVLFTLSTRG